MPRPNLPLVEGSARLRAQAWDRHPEEYTDASARKEFLLQTAASQMAIGMASSGGSVDLLQDRVGYEQSDPVDLLSARERRFLPAAQHVVMALHALGVEHHADVTPALSEPGRLP